MEKPVEEPPSCICGCGKPALYAAEHCDRKFASYITSVDYTLKDTGHDTPCWIWKGRFTPGKYRNTTIRGKSSYVHRAMYEQVKGPIPEGMWIDHLCRIRCCCNPDHLEPVTPAENTRRGVAKLTREDLHTIYRSKRGEGPMLAERFGVAHTTISTVKTGKSWRDEWEAFHAEHPE